MPILGYTGLPRSGKTYQIVLSLILPAMRTGRRVVTNIEGINEAAIHARLHDEKIPPANWGALLYVDSDTLFSDDFYYHPEAKTNILQPGDLLIVDEAWEYYEDNFITPRCMNFFRYHGHYKDSVSSIVCDIVLISQDISDIGRKVRRVIDKTIYIEKLDAVGMDSRYRLDIYSKTRVGRISNRLYSEIKKYESWVFQLYDSHKKNNDDPFSRGRELKIESRASIFKTPLFKYGIPLSLIALLSLSWFIPKYFGYFIDKYTQPPNASAVASQTPPPDPAVDLLAQPTALALPLAPSSPPRLPLKPGEISQPVRLFIPPDDYSNLPPSPTHALIGFYVVGQSHFVILRRGDTTELHKLKRGDFLDKDMLHPHAVIDGYRITPYTGNTSYGKIPGMPGGAQTSTSQLSYQLPSPTPAPPR